MLISHTWNYGLCFSCKPGFKLDIKHCLLHGTENTNQFRCNARLGSCWCINHYLAICKWGVWAQDSSQTCSSELNSSLHQDSFGKLHLCWGWRGKYRHTDSLYLTGEIVTLRNFDNKATVKKSFCSKFCSGLSSDPYLSVKFSYWHCRSEQNKKCAVRS